MEQLIIGLLVGVFEFIDQLDAKVDKEDVVKKAIETVKKNRAAKAAAEEKEDDVFTSVDKDTEGEG